MIRKLFADGSDRRSRSRPLDWHRDCPGPRFWRRRVRGRFPWRVRGRSSRRVRERFSRRVRARLPRRLRARLLRRVRRFLSGLLRVWLFPVLLLLLLIAYSLRPETAQPSLAGLDT
jgi:hypothetical protein